MNEASATTGGARLALTKAEPHVIEQYGSQTREAVDALASALHDLFLAQRRGRIGRTWVKKLEPLFELWCEQSGVVTPSRARRRLADENPETVEDLARILKTDLGFPGTSAHEQAEQFIAAVRGGTDREEATEKLLNSLYDQHVRSLCLQSAHVTLARAVFYRVLEDKELAQQRVSGETLSAALAAAQEGLVGSSPIPAFALLQEMREQSEDFMPLLYELRELDWWLTEPPLTERQREELGRLMGPVELELQRMLRLLDGFDFSEVDRDVWKDVYQHHLPWEVRQRLGGFYTPDALVELTLDLAGWHADDDRIVDAPIVDISCGSGTFLVEALRRRRQALDGHGRLGPDPSPEQLDSLLDGIAGLDIHPFATFLATTNLVFQVIDLYTSVRRRHPGYRLKLDVFTVDSLEEGGVHARQASLRQKIPEDIRVHHTEQEIARYQEIVGRRFDYAVGNPPWGGVLKGKLSPLFDPDKRESYREGRVYESATDKFDIYTLFIERSLHWLADGGRYALVTPNSYRDKDFGAGIRAYLAAHAPPETIVDLGPYGQTLFRAMNTPCVTAGAKPRETDELLVVAVGKGLQFEAPAAQREARQRELVAVASNALTNEPEPGSVVGRFSEPMDEVQSWGAAPWRLHPLRRHRATIERAGDASIGVLFEPLQGVTPSGEGALDIFQMPPDLAKAESLESELVHFALKGLDVPRWLVQPADTVMLYPYIKVEGEFRPAFRIGGADSEVDALELRPRSAEEEELVAGLREDEERERLLTHRVAAGSCPYPNAAKYLLRHYEQLASRRPKGRPLRSFGRNWYEYLWPRDAARMLAAPKLVTPRLTRWPRFALDEEGLLPSDSCVAVESPTTREGKAKLEDLRRAVEDRAGREISQRELLIYAMAFLNSAASGFLLKVGRESTPKGSWNLNEEYLRLVRLAVPSVDLLEQILSTATDCVETTRRGEDPGDLEVELDALIFEALGLSGTELAREVTEWAQEERARDA